MSQIISCLSGAVVAVSVSSIFCSDAGYAISLASGFWASTVLSIISERMMK